LSFAVDCVSTALPSAAKYRFNSCMALAGSSATGAMARCGSSRDLGGPIPMERPARLVVVAGRGTAGIQRARRHLPARQPVRDHCG
jgi:hypothetical protein